jgi:signal transduction histidine kinase
LRRLGPQSLAGQLILVVALALLVAQAINFALLVRERQRQIVTGAAAPAVVRLLDALERHTTDEGPPDRDGRQRVRFAIRPPVMIGTPRPDIVRRATDMLADQGLVPKTVVAMVDESPARPNRLRALRDRVRADHGHPDHVHTETRLTLAVEYEAGKWVSVQSRFAGNPPRFGGWLIVQTLILYVIVLIPLALVGRRLARPLKDLTGSAQQFARSGAADPVEERGPGDVRELMTAFNAMRARIFAMLDEKDRMLGAIGHDLRTPLASLRVRTESVEDDGERARMSETIDEMNRMLEDILALARAGRSMEAVQKVDLSALADAVVDDFLELGAPVDLVEGDRIIGAVRPQLIRRALRNLIENAIKYGERAHVSVSRDRRALHICVADDGPGIAEDRMEEMMQPFTRLEGSRNRETGGSGLGLALVRAIMAEHHGTLQLANRPEGGLVASLILPYRIDTPAPAEM